MIILSYYLLHTIYILTDNILIFSYLPFVSVLVKVPVNSYVYIYY